MTPNEIRRELHDILNAHDAALDAIRQANQERRHVTAGMRQANEAMDRAIDAHDAAIVSAIDANRAALRLLNRMEQDGTA